MKASRGLIALLGGLFWAGMPMAAAQDLEPRRWTHLPVGLNVVGVGYGYTDGDLSFDPVLRIEDAEVEMHSGLASYLRSFGLLGKSARFDVRAPYQSAHWQGKVDGVPDSVRRAGFADPRIRLSVNLLGAPALEGEEFLEHRTAYPTRTVLGAAVAVTLPLGEYKEDKLLNLGQNRFTIRPQFGVLHTRGPWSYELTGSVFFFTDNDEFFDGNEFEQDPLFALQAHVVRTFEPGWWLAAGVGYGRGGESTVNGDEKDDLRSDILFGVALGLPVARNQSVKLAYVLRRSQEDVGIDSDSLAVGWSIQF